MSGSPATVRLRLATPADAEPIATLFRASRGLLTFLPDLHTAEEDRAYVEGNLLATERVTVAESGGSILGFMAETEGWINHLYIAPDALGQGIGTALLSDAQRRGNTLTLWCFRDNQRARTFYEKHGFVIVETTDGADNEARAPDIRYRWPR